MASPEPDADPASRLLRNGFVTLHRDPAALDATVGDLAGRGYRVHRLDAASWTSRADFHRDAAAVLGFPDHYGHNLDAFGDSLRDTVLRDAPGTVLVFAHYDAFARREPRAAQAILDVVADAGRTALVHGRRVLCLVQSDDPDLRFAPVGATPVEWVS